MQITKETILKEFSKNNVPVRKINKSKLGGFYVYHQGGMSHTYKKYTTISRTEGSKTMLRESIPISCSFVDDEDLLYMAIAEAKRRLK